MSDDRNFLTVQSVSKHFKIGSSVIQVLRGVSFRAGRGEWTVLLGASGSGKTTLLDIIGTISRPDSGSVVIDGVNPAELSGSKLVTFRRKNIGFVFQSYHILPELNILENVMLPSLLDGKSSGECRKRALDLLERVGLKDRIGHRANELSGGEQQRAAIARAMMNEPRLLLADEPTGNLDEKTGNEIMALFHRINQEQNVTIIMVTHNPMFEPHYDKVIRLRDGRIVQTKPTDSVDELTGPLSGFGDLPQDRMAADAKATLTTTAEQEEGAKK